MEPAQDQRCKTCHVVAMPYPGRGHINPMMNLCKQLVRRNPSIHISFVVTEEWLGFISSDPKPNNIRFVTLPNIIPSELGRANDFPGFVQAVFTKLEEPFEQLLDRLEPPAPAAIIADTYVVWAARVGNRRNIPVVSLWTMSATVLSVFSHFELLVQNQHFPSEDGDEVVNYIPGVAPTRLSDLPTIYHGVGREVLPRVLECFQEVQKAQYILFTSFYELETRAIDALATKLPIPLYPIGPSIPYQEFIDSNDATASEYLHWLDFQPKDSVLYISLGSFLSVSKSQMDEIMAGVRGSGVRYLWVARGLKESYGNIGDDGRGLVVSWCDQLRVLCHPSVGGFWTHCGFNSTLEGIYSGVPMLTFPIFWDQMPDSKMIVEDWKIGWRVRKKSFGGEEALVTRDEIKEIVKRFMDLGDDEGMAIRKRALELSEICRGAVGKGGSSDTNMDAFINDIVSKAHSY